MDKIAIYTSSGPFVVPLDVSGIELTLQAAGGAGSARGGGGAGSWCVRVPLAVTPGETLAVVIGAKGIAMVSPGDIYYGSTDGGDTYIGIIRVGGGKAPFAEGGNPSFPRAGFGGGFKGAEATNFNDPGMLSPRTFVQPLIPIKFGQDSVLFWGGASGGGGPGAGKPENSDGGSAVNINQGGPAGGVYLGSPPDPYSGGGGASSPFGLGGYGGNYWLDAPTRRVGQSPSASNYGVGGGSGCSDFAGGNGVGGKAMIKYISSL